MRKFTLLLVIITLFLSYSANAQITTYPYSEDFETGDGGWVLDNTTNGSWALGTPAAAVINSAASGSNSWATNLTGDYNLGDSSTVTSPIFDLSALAAPAISFSIWWESEFSWDGTVLQSSIDGGTTWVNVGAFGDIGWYTDNTIGGNPGGQPEGWTGRNGTGSNGWITANHALTGLAGEASVQLRFAFGSDGSVQDEGVAFDDVNVFEVTCPEPSNAAFVSATATTANLSWTAGPVTAWEVVVQPQGTGLPSVPGVSTTNNPYVAMGLTPATNYEAYVRSDCAGDFSIWVGPINFATECTTFVAPYTEGFENGGTIPLCWTMNGGEDWNFNDVPGFNHIGNNGVITGSTATNGFFAWVDASGDDGPTTLVTPLVDVSGLTTPAITFYEISDNEGNANSTLDVEVWDGAAWNPMATYNTNTSGWEQRTINISTLTITGDVQARFIFSETVTGDFYDDIAIDDVTFDELPTCVNPSNLAVNSTTSATATLSWVSNGTETAWEVAIQAPGTGIPTGAGAPAATNPYVAMGLTPATTYEYYVRSDCGTEFSDWIGPLTFDTECVTFIAPYTEGFENAGTIPLCWTMNGGGDIWEFSDNGTGNHIGNNGVITGSTATNGFFAWVDSSGDDGIRQLISPLVDVSPLTTPALSFFEISDNEGNANSQLDVEVWDGAAWNPMGTYNTNTAGWELKIIDISTLTITGDVQARFTFSEIVTGDFYDDIAIDDVTFDELPTCVIPGGLNVTNITGTTADFSWMAGAGESSWEYVLQPTGTGVPTGAGTNSTTTTVNLNALTFETTYEVYVRSDCGVNGFSDWAGPLTFTTTVQLNFNVDCSVGPTTFNYCYDSNDTNVFTFISTDGSPLNFTINSGDAENNWDELIVFDTDGTTDLNAATPYGNGGDLSGITYQSTGDTISFQITSDGSISCQSSTNINPLDITVSCATCINPIATYQVVDDCANGAQFLVDVNVTSLGDATSLSIEDNQGNPPVSVSTTGITQFGPYPFNTDIIFTVSNEQDVNCVLTSSAYNIPTCPPANDNCDDAISVTANTDGNCTSFVSGTLFGATESPQANPCTGTADDDVWFTFTAINTDHAISFSNIVGPTTFLSHGLYEGTDCDNLTNLYCSTADNSTANGLIVGNTYYIRVFTFNNTPFQDVTFDLCVFSIPPPITTNITQYTVTELIEDVLINSPCSSISNITSSTGTDFGSDNGIGYFEANGSGFPFESGIIMTTGNAVNAPGPETGTLSDGGGAGWLGDADLEAEINEGVTNNASIIEFDFVPFIQDMSFEFIFAAEEYGTFQCGFSDAFAFLLTDTVTGITTNIAVIPGTTTPVSVFTIRDAAFNNGCPSANPALFDAYYGAGGLPPLTNPTNFIGRTVPLFAMSTVVPNRTYHIKLVIADDGDTAYDSAVFLKAGSFEIGEVDLGDDILLGSGNANCEGDEVILDIGVPVSPLSTITWYTLDNGIQEPILDDMGMPQNGSTLAVTENGNYIVEIVLDSNASCFVVDEIIVEFFPNPIANPAPDIVGCDLDNSGMALFDLTENDAIIIGTQTGMTISYYTTEQDAIDSVNPIANATSYQSAPSIIYYSIEDDTTGCSRVSSFNLLLAPKPILVQADNILGCDDDEDGVSNYDLTSNEDVITNGQTGFVFSYYTTLVDAETSTNVITNPSDFDGGAQTIYVRVEDVNGCFDVTTFDLDFGISPMSSFNTTIVYEVCPNATVPITVEAIGDNYTEGEVTISWYNEGVLVSGQTDLTIDNVLTTGTYTIEVMYNDTGCTASEDIFVEELETCIIPQGISPNGDGKNDTFDLSSYDVQSLTIFNRNGVKVYEKTNYLDEWHGQSLDGDKLPVGTYYYVMNYQGTKTKAAWVYINREKN
ncbi:choice-of-anchor L domain-containing protein [Lacinutrix jangbogonensis]|uniref:choice-of-anchor L domain-containing protein n=1 Tax=Lacinutrix jangbogonensis TaxID=1469557 RepID=UPI00068C5F86|nr:choice-of-anchor L domain-containing protein [Lacinutrix jangbogonensis]